MNPLPRPLATLTPILLLALGLLTVLGRPAHSETGFAIGDDAPDFSLVDQIGAPRTLLGDFVGAGAADPKLTFLDFCAMWCTPCQQATAEI